MSILDSSHHKQKCTLIETIHEEVELIIRSDDSPNLEVLKFSNLRNCMEYVDKNKFQIAVTHWGENESVREREL